MGVQTFNFQYGQRPELVQATSLMAIVLPLVIFFLARARLYARRRHHQHGKVTYSREAEGTFTFSLIIQRENSIMTQPFLLGVNYWPRRKAMYWWPQFDAAKVRDEFDVVKDIGLNVVRLFLLWDDWQPTPDTVSSQRLKDLITVADIAAERGLGLDVTFFTGDWSAGVGRRVGCEMRGKLRRWRRLRQLVDGGQVVGEGLPQYVQ